MRGKTVQVTAEPAERLFRSLLRPLPSKPIRFRFAGVEHPPLVVAAIPAAQVNEAADVASLYSETQRASVQTAGVIARALRAGGVRVFCSHEDVLALPESELLALSVDVLAALGEICPLYQSLGTDAWTSLHARLCEGARHPSNFTASTALGRCFESAGMSGRLVERPDWYWGVPLCDMLDGHWMVYRACRAVYESQHK